MLPQARQNADHCNWLVGDEMAKQNLGISAMKITFWTKIKPVSNLVALQLAHIRKGTAEKDLHCRPSEWDVTGARLPTASATAVCSGCWASAAQSKLLLTVLAGHPEMQQIGKKKNKNKKGNVEING